MIIVIVADTQRFESDGISEEAIGHGPVRFRAPRSIIIAVAVGCICCFFFHCLLALDLRVLCVINEFLSIYGNREDIDKTVIIANV